jgi:hypothetical protein
MQEVLDFFKIKFLYIRWGLDVNKYIILLNNCVIVKLFANSNEIPKFLTFAME